MLWKYAARRALAAIPVVLGVTVITFLLMHATGGGYVPGIDDDPRLSAATVAALRHQYGLDQPLWTQYGLWLLGLLHGDFGRSMIDGSLVTDDLLSRLPLTLELTLTAIGIGVVISIPIAVLSARRRGGVLDSALTTLSVVGFAVPEFWLGLMLILGFAVFPAQHLGGPLLPASGAVSAIDGGGPLDRVLHLLLPATVLSFGYVSVWSRFGRSRMIEVLSQDYVRTARAKGMAERRVIYMHALRNAVIPLITLIGLELPGLASGGVIVEVVFGWPGVGRYVYQSALAYDYTTVMGLTMFAAVLVVVGNLLADLLYAVLDPRVRYS